MPTPKKNETQQEFVSRCVPVVIEDRGLNAGDEGERRQAIAICYSMWRQAKKEGESMDEETTITTDDIADVLIDDNVTVTHPVTEKQATAHTAIRLHGQGGIFSVQGEGEEKQLGGATSFRQLEEMRQMEETATEVMSLAETFNRLTSNIMASPDVGDKAAAMSALVKEFTALMEGKIKQATYNCECTKCGYMMKSAEHCNDIQCPKCGAEMRRAERPGPGKEVYKSITDSDKRILSGQLKKMPMRDVVATHRRLHQMAARGASLTNFSRTDMNWFNAACESELARRAREGDKKPSGASPLEWGGKESSENVEEKHMPGQVGLIARRKENLLSRVMAAVKSAFTWEPESEEGSDLMLWKEGDRWRWLAVFSNKYRDRDNPPEILASFAHKEFVAAVDAGDWPMPELRHWHIPGTRWGMADWLAYDDKGFVLASGWIDKGHEKEAEAAAAGEPVKVSHGMPPEEIRREKDDPTVIVRYRTAEISDLPAWAAANPLTGFHIIEQEVKGMSLPSEKKDYLLGRGLTEEQVDAIEADLASKAKAADELGLEHKESDEPPESGETAEGTEPQEETPGEEDQPEYVTRAEIETAMKEFSQALKAEFDALHKEIAGLQQSDEKKVAKALRSTPAASLAQMMVAQLKGEPIGVPVKDGEKIKGPEETPHDQEGGIPVLTALMGGGDWRKAMGIPEGGNNTS